MTAMQNLVEALCSEECAGRRPGTPEGRAARRVVLEAMRGAGLDPFEQDVPGCRGANVIAKLDGDSDRYVLVGAHFDHLGQSGKTITRRWRRPRAGSGATCARRAPARRIASSSRATAPTTPRRYDPSWTSSSRSRSSRRRRGPARAMAEQLLAATDRNGRLPAARRGEVGMLIAAIESRLA